MSILFKRIKDWATSITAFRTGDVIPVDGPNGTAKMTKDNLLKETAQNALGGNVALEFVPNETNVIAERPYVYGGKLYLAVEDYTGAWDAGKFVEVSIAELLKNTYNATDAEIAYDGFSSLNAADANLNDTPFILRTCDVADVYGLMLNISTAGSLSIGYYSGICAYGIPIDSEKLVYGETLQVKVGIQVLALSKSLHIPQGSVLVIGKNTDTAKFKYGGKGNDKGFLYVRNNSVLASNSSVGISVVGRSKNEGYVAEKVGDFIAKGFSGNGVELVSAYDVRNNTNIAISNAPFILNFHLPKNQGVNSIALNVYQTGYISIGVVKASDVAAGVSFDVSKFITKAKVFVKTTGFQKIVFDIFSVEKDEFIWISSPTDTAKYYYGPYGGDFGFLYVTGGSTYAQSVSSLGINIYGPETSKKYRGKKISILGDSISTFAGYIPEGNATYYPTGTVKYVTDTWWKKLLNLLGAELLVNNSWSGSRVTTTAGDASAGCMTRCESLGANGENPDIIIVWMGINDFNNEVGLGTYDGKSSVPETTTTFREAYGIMLNKILTNYPKAEVYVCTLPQCERNGSSGFPEVNGNDVPLVDYNIAIEELARAFGVKVLDHNRCGLTYQNMSVYNPDQLHPNKYGHSLVANNDIRQMDASVNIVYSVE